MRIATLLVLVTAVGTACSEAGSQSRPSPDAASVGRSDSSGSAESTQGDTAAPDTSDPAWANAPAATPWLMAGAARRSLGMPVGIPTVGNGPEAGPRSRFAVIYPATQAQHTDPNVKALVLRRQGKALVLVRTETIGIWQDLVEDLKSWLRVRGRADLAEGLIIGATHTHSSGGRVFDHPVGEIAVDNFLPPLYQEIRDALGQAVLDADANAVEARFGYTSIEVPELHVDRRCENPEYQDDQMGIIKIEDADGRVLSVVVNYAMHGTVLGRSVNHLSYDAPGAIEQAIETQLSQPAEVLYFQSWAGDMGPGEAPHRVTDEGFDLHPEFTRIDEIGAEAAARVLSALETVTTTSDPTLDVQTIRIPLDPELINPPEVFGDYPYGGIYCLSPEENCRGVGQPYSALHCVGFPVDYTIFSTLLSAARIGDLALVTLPGEPVTEVGTTLRDTVKSDGGWGEVFVLGYSQSYLSYLLFEEDFWWGGYEGASALMGPGFARYLVDRSVRIARRLDDPEADLGFEPVPFDFGPPLEFPAYDIEPAMGTIGIVEDAPFDGKVKRVSFLGGDPALGTPVISLEQQLRDGSWEPSLRPNGAAFDSRGPEIVLTLAVEPGYDTDMGPVPRVFEWTAVMPARLSVPPAGGQLQGTFRFRIDGTTPDAYQLYGQAFVIE